MRAIALAAARSVPTQPTSRVRSEMIVKEDAQRKRSHRIVRLICNDVELLNHGQLSRFPHAQARPERGHGYEVNTGSRVNERITLVTPGMEKLY